MTKPVLIVGGGMSGLAAAVELSASNIPVLLLEQKPKLGGRAFSFTDPVTGDIIDNGQHVLIAGYRRTMYFLERIGSKHLLSIQPRLTLLFHHPRKGMCTFKLPALPAPFHLFAGILSSDLFSFSDKIKLLRGGAAIHFPAVVFDQTIEQWLKASGQSSELIESFWEPLAISIMNERVGTASAKVFVNSLRYAFNGAPSDACLAIPCVGLSELYVNPAAKFIGDHSGVIKISANVATILREGKKASGVRLKDGSEIHCSSLILAVPQFRIAELVRENFPEIRIPPELAASASPIVSVHFWFKNDFMPEAFVGLIGRRVQWVFNKRKISHESGSGGHLSCVMSAAYGTVDRTNDEIVQMTLDDLRSVYERADLQPRHTVVIREKRATFSCTPEIEPLRPHAYTSVPNLFLAGDWTNTSFPATIEGAIMSGETCAGLAARS